MHKPEFTQQILHKNVEARGPTQTPLVYANPNDLEIKMVHRGHRCHTSNLRGEPGNVVDGSSENCPLWLTSPHTTPYGIYQARFLPFLYLSGRFKVHKFTIPYWMNRSING